MATEPARRQIVGRLFSLAFSARLESEAAEQTVANGGQFPSCLFAPTFPWRYPRPTQIEIDRRLSPAPNPTEAVYIENPDGTLAQLW